MLFVHDVLVPEQVFDPRLRAVLTATEGAPGAKIGTSDLLVGAFRSDAASRDVLAQSVRAQMAPPTMSDPLCDARMLPGSQTRARSDFSAGALRALAETEAFLHRAPRQAQPFALDFLLYHACAAAGEGGQGLGWLDVPRAAARFRGRVEQAGRSQAADTTPPLPPELGLSQDLSRLAQTCKPLSESPFDGDPQYQRLFDDLARPLHRREGRHVLLVGERGVAKTTVVAELARRAANGAYPSLVRKRFVLIDARYVVPDESRAHLEGILKSVAERPELVACVDGFGALLRSDRPAANQATLFQGLSRVRGQIVALLTPREYEAWIADDPDFGEFFARVDVEEPAREPAMKLLRHYAQGLGEKFGIHIEDDAVRQAVDLTAEYVLNDHLPSKALKVLTRICEDLDYARVRESADQAGPAQARLGETCVTATAVVREVSRASGVPEETLRGVAEQTDYAQALGEVIFGQEHAIREVANELGLIKAGMTDPGKPASVMLFLGQTGTGKTELAKALARFYSQSRRLRTYALGNCVEPHSVSTIIGVPPGYVGTDQGGRIVHELNADPYCVFLLDEADKAHPDVLQPFLNLFDEGWVSDQRGVRAYAEKSIFILTSNVGQRMLAQLTKEGKGIDEITARMREALSQIRHTKSDRPVFTPEFLARIKRIIVFKPLTQLAMEGISRKLTAELCRSWQAKRGRRLEVPETLIAHLAAESHRRNEKSNGKEGGRIVRKLLADWVESPLQREVSRRPHEYRACASITLAFEPAETPATTKDTTAAEPPVVRVCFQQEGEGEAT